MCFTWVCGERGWPWALEPEPRFPNHLDDCWIHCRNIHTHTIIHNGEFNLSVNHSIRLWAEPYLRSWRVWFFVRASAIFFTPSGPMLFFWRLQCMKICVYDALLKHTHTHWNTDSLQCGELSVWLKNLCQRTSTFILYVVTLQATWINTHMHTHPVTNTHMHTYVHTSMYKWNTVGLKDYIFFINLIFKNQKYIFFK